jgi:hypothetical protein
VGVYFLRKVAVNLSTAKKKKKEKKRKEKNKKKNKPLKNTLGGFRSV